MNRSLLQLWLLVGVVALLLFAVPAHTATSPPGFSIADVSCPESAGSCALTITKSTRANSYSKIRVYTWADGTATSGVDFSPVNKTVTFANNQLSAVVSVPIINDSLSEGNETFHVEIASERFAAIARAEATVTIVDDDSPPPPPTVAWTHCAWENTTCFIVGTANVRYGFGTTWTAQRSVTGSIACGNATWGDPLVGTGKECVTDGAVAAPVPAPTPTPTPTPSPLPVAPQTCWNGWVISASLTCPSPPPPVPASWIAAPLTEGGYARVIADEQSAPKMPDAMHLPQIAYSEANYRTVKAGEVVRLSGAELIGESRHPPRACAQCAERPYWTVWGLDGRFIGDLWQDNLAGVALGP